MGIEEAATEIFNDAKVFVDSTGAGEPVFEALRIAGVRCEAYPFTAKSKTALIDNLSLMLEKKRITLPRPDLWPVGVDELESFQFSVTEITGNLRMGSPSGQHDDTVIGLALAAWHLREKRSTRPYFRVL